MNKITAKKRIKIISFLLMLSLVLTTGTFAFWASYVDGTKEEATGTLTIGYAEGIETRFEITNELNSGGYLIPTGQLNNSLSRSTECITLSYDLLWKEDANRTQLEGATAIGKVSVSHRVVITVDGVELNSSIYSSIFNLIQVDYSVENLVTLILDGDIETFTFYISMDEPKNQREYNIISNATIAVIFSFRILDNFIEVNDDQTTINRSYMTLNGEDVVYVEITESYKDEGIIAYNSLGEVIRRTWTSGGANVWELGTYKLTYGAYSNYDNEAVPSIYRTIIVIDTIAPIININGAEVYNVTLGRDFNDWGAWALDNSYQFISVETTGVNDVNVNIAGTYYITYTATDYSGNQSTAIRTVIVK